MSFAEHKWVHNQLYQLHGFLYCVYLLPYPKMEVFKFGKQEVLQIPIELQFKLTFSSLHVRVYYFFSFLIWWIIIIHLVFNIMSKLQKNSNLLYSYNNISNMLIFIYTLQQHVKTKVHYGYYIFVKCINLVFFKSFVAIEQIDIPRLLSQQGGETVYPLPRIRSLEVHPKLNLAALMFAVMCC